MSQEVGISKHLIWKDIVFIFEQRTERKSLGKDEISVFEQDKRNQTVSII